MHLLNVGIPPCGKVFTAYFQELEEESLKDNFVIIYELLDEMMDFGYPQATDAKILQEYAPRCSSRFVFRFSWPFFFFFFFASTRVVRRKKIACCSTCVAPFLIFC